MMISLYQRLAKLALVCITHSTILNRFFQYRIILTFFACHSISLTHALDAMLINQEMTDAQIIH